MNFKTLYKFLWNVKRFYKNIFNKKINIVFVCHRPAVWASLKTVFENCNNDEKFNVTIVAIPNKKQIPDKGFNHKVFESEGAEEFFKNYPCKVINGYNYKTRKWFNLKSLKPDYIFMQQPYNICRPKQYRSKRISKYAKLLYVHYAANFIGNGLLEETYPKDFIKDVDTIFFADKIDEKLVNDYIQSIKTETKGILTGFPRYDGLNEYKNKNSDNWNLPKSPSIKRIIWTPRWNTKENNCNFFEYKDKILDYIEKNDDIDFIFRPHPQAFLEWEATGELSKKEAEEYKNRYNNIKNAKIDTEKSYLNTFYSSDILITDMSSIIAEYFLTEKPIIYCHKSDCFNEFSRKLSEGFYWVRNWNELKSTLDMLNSFGGGYNDILKEKRKEIIKECFYINPKGAGYTIKELIKKDFYGDKK